MKQIKYLFFPVFLLVTFSCDYNPYSHGKRLYETFCASCHGLEGEGFRDLYPPLNQSDYFQNDPFLAACIIRHGIEDQIVVNGKTYQQPMLAIENLNAIEITNILNYIAHSWNAGIVTPLHQDSVKKHLKDCEDWPILR